MFGRLFTVGKENVFGLYCNSKGVSYATPPGTEHVAHIVWRDPARGQDSNIDYFLANGSFALVPNESVHIQKSECDKILEGNCGVRYQIISGFKEHESLVRVVAARDISDFLAGKREKRDRETLFSRKVRKKKSQSGGIFQSTIEYVSGITGVPVQNVAPANLALGGKQDFYAGCLLDINLDFAKWCPSGISPDGKIAGWNSCEYCYASHTHAGYPGAFYVERAELGKQLRGAREKRAEEGKPTRYLRLGKRTECGAKMFRTSLVNTLEACVDERIKCIFPTKFLEFDRDVAELLKRTDSTLLISLGSDELEKGAVLHGRTQEVRVSDGLKYLEAGVRTIPYVLVDAAKQNGGEYFERNLLEVREKFPKIQLLPIRLRHAQRAVRILGGWHGLIRSNEGQPDLFGGQDGKYEKGNDGTRIAVSMHSSLVVPVGDNNGNVRMCHHNSCKEYCGMCFMPGETGFARSSS